MSSMSQYYSNDNITQRNNNREPPHLLSSSFIQPELNSQAQQQFSTMSDNDYQTSTDQFGIHSNSPSLGQPSAPISEPPPYEEFVEYNWPSGMSTDLIPSTESFGGQLFNPDEQYFLEEIFGKLDSNDNFLFNPTLPINMPEYPDPSSSHHLNSPSIVDNNVYNILPSQASSSSPSSTPDLLNRNQFPSSNSTSLSPRTSNITLSSSPPPLIINNNDVGDDASSSEGGKVDGSSTPTVPSKRKQENDDDRSRRRASNPRLSPINTKFSMSQSSNNNSNNNNNNNNNNSSNNNNGSRPLSPSMQLSTLSINNGNGNHNNNNNYDDSPVNTPSSSNNNSSSPTTPTMEIINAKNEDDTDLITTNNNSSNNYSNVDDQNDEFSPTDVKTEDSTSPSSSSTSKPIPQKSSRKPYKELLTEEEKRANHIASEQKRRNTIRAGFKELTDIIPTLKNVNNSKSTILFKAVDYIKYLERRNRNLKERAGLLEMRVEMEMRQGKRFHHHHHPHGNPFGPTSMGFGHQRVAPMPMNYGVIPNGMAAIPIGPSGHPTQRQPSHVMTPHHQIYFVPSNENPPIIPGNVVSQSNNNMFNRGTAMGMQIPLSSQQQQNHHHSQQDNVPGMNIPTMASDDDGNNGGVDIDGDSSMLGINGSATPRVGVKC